MNAGVPNNLADFSNYVVNRAGQPEIVTQPLYDYILYPTAGAPQFTFFQNPIGQGITSAIGGTVGSTKTIQDTNMTIGGQLPQPQAFRIGGIQVRFMPGSVSTANTFTMAKPSQAATVAAAAVTAQLDDVKTLTESGTLTLLIGSKNYLQYGPLGYFPPTTAFAMDAAIGNSDTTTHNEVAAVTGQAGGQPFFLDIPITLTASMNWSITLSWPGAVATPSGFNGRLGVILDGFLLRDSQ